MCAHGSHCLPALLELLKRDLHPKTAGCVQQDNSLVSREDYMISLGLNVCVCVWGRVVAVVTSPVSGEEEVQSGRVRLDEEGYMDGG